jgi:hypothetical protein
MDEKWTKRSRQAKTPSHSAWAESVGRRRSAGARPTRITKHLPDPTSRGVAKLGGGGKSHFWRPRPPLRFLGFRIYLITCPTQLRMFCEVIKKSYWDNSENQMTGTEDRKKLFRPPSRTPYDNLGETQVCCPPRKRASTGQVWPRCGPGKCPKKGVEIWGSPQKNSPIFGGIAKKKVPSGSRGRAAPPPVVASEPTAGCLDSTHPKNHLTRRQLSAFCSSQILKADSLK